jgi:hypothetical protein
MMAIQHSVTFSLQACLEFFSLIPNQDKTTGGAHQVVAYDHIIHQSHCLIQPPWPSGVAGKRPPCVGEEMGAGGVINGTGATCLSGRVKVLPLLSDADGRTGVRVGMGLDEE